MARLPVYLRILYELAADRVASVSSERLAELAGVNAAKVRKDLSYLGSYGTRGVGYEVDYLLFQMSRELGLTHDWPVVIVGAGNLGQALANYAGFGERGFPVAAVVDVDPAKVGTTIGRVPRPPHRRPARAGRPTGHAIGVIATPAGAAQDAADRLVAAGVTAILNFAPRDPDRAPGRERPQGRPGRRAADPQLLPAASLAGSDQRGRRRSDAWPSGQRVRIRNRGTGA